jgi:hypothetical protein
VVSDRCSVKVAAFLCAKRSAPASEYAELPLDDVVGLLSELLLSDLLYVVEVDSEFDVDH